jgi:hypothetical protein
MEKDNAKNQLAKYLANGLRMTYSTVAFEGE